MHVTAQPTFDDVVAKLLLTEYARMILAIGPQYHPDTSPDDYRYDSSMGGLTWSAVEHIHQAVDMISDFDPYDFTMRVWEAHINANV